MQKGVKHSPLNKLEFKAKPPTISVTINPPPAINPLDPPGTPPPPGKDPPDLEAVARALASCCASRANASLPSWWEEGVGISHRIKWHGGMMRLRPYLMVRSWWWYCDGNEEGDGEDDSKMILVCDDEPFEFDRICRHRPQTFQLSHVTTWCAKTNELTGTGVVWSLPCFSYYNTFSHRSSGHSRPSRAISPYENNIHRWPVFTTCSKSCYRSCNGIRKIYTLFKNRWKCPIWHAVVALEGNGFMFVRYSFFHWSDLPDYGEIIILVDLHCKRSNCGKLVPPTAGHRKSVVSQEVFNNKQKRQRRS